MKSKLVYLLLSITILLGSCSYLDYNEEEGYEKEDMFEYFNRSKGMLTTVYSYLPSDFGNFGGSTRAGATDEAEYVWNQAIIHRYNNGSWSPILTIDDVWGTNYRGIRAANLFLENHQTEFPNIQWNTDYAEIIKQNTYYPYEARFLRTFFYFELIKRYKNVPLVKNTLDTDEVNQLSPASFEEVVDFIVKECDEIIPKLPENYENIAGKETGRATRGAAMALKSRVLLYAASPLFNATQDKEKWVVAAKAAKDLIDWAESENRYQLVPNEAPVNNLLSKELILERRLGNSNSFEALNFPIGFEGGNSGLNPTQNLVDAFEMQDGSTFDWNNEDHVMNIHNPDRRDPRLFKTVLANGSVWKGTTIETFTGGKHLPATGGSKTGYYLKKYLVESVNLNPNNPTTARHIWVLFRYSEILLNYAEALYEAYADSEYKDAVFTLSPSEAINKVRTRANMPNVKSDNFRARIRNERQVELAFEDHRFWDIRRWKVAPETTDIYGVRIQNNNDGFKYTRQLVSERYWDDKMYLYPISNDERYKNSLLGQNPGWE